MGRGSKIRIGGTVFHRTHRRRMPGTGSRSQIAGAAAGSFTAWDWEEGGWRCGPHRSRAELAASRGRRGRRPRRPPWRQRGGFCRRRPKSREEEGEEGEGGRRSASRTSLGEGGGRSPARGAANPAAAVRGFGVGGARIRRTSLGEGGGRSPAQGVANPAAAARGFGAGGARIRRRRRAPARRRPGGKEAVAVLELEPVLCSAGDLEAGCAGGRREGGALAREWARRPAAAHRRCSEEAAPEEVGA